MKNRTIDIVEDYENEIDNGIDRPDIFEKRLEKIKKAYANASPRLHISKGNTKLGYIYNFSLLPLLTCGGACKHCGSLCYAAKICTGYSPDALRAWSDNTRFVKADLAAFIESMNEFLADKKPAVFRVHVSGDFYSLNYFSAWIEIAKHNPNTRFFAFTKQFSLIQRAKKEGVKIPSNFNIILSDWFEHKAPAPLRYRFPIASVYEEYQPAPVIRNRDTIICRGDCSKCSCCASLTKKQQVLFKLH